MRTTLNLDDKAVEEAMKVSGGSTKTAVINEALREFARRRRLEGYRSLRGKFDWQGNLDDLRRRQPERR
jgi:Arc/MetJ family transcription regulator